jgi:hypothetical protein
LSNLYCDITENKMDFRLLAALPFARRACLPGGVTDGRPAGVPAPAPTRRPIYNRRPQPAFS